MAHSRTLTAHDLWEDIEAVRTHAPLVHNITNLVVMNLNANALLAIGASPVMAHAHEEVSDMVAIAQALVINMGTLDPYWISAMAKAMASARAGHKRIPIVLDPVGAGATPYRNTALALLLDTASPSVIRGNGSEIMSTADAAITTKGVDSTVYADDALSAAHALAARTQGVVGISGVVDHVIDHTGRHATLANGHYWMTKITGVGCSSTAIIGALCAVQADAWRATVSAMALMSVAGEMAAEKAIQTHQGVGTMAVYLLDALQLMRPDDFTARLKLSTPAVHAS